MTPDEIVREITRRAWSFGVAVILSPEDHLMADNVRCSGYFDGDSTPPLLAVATGRDQDRWLGTLLHEYSHLTQWVEQAPCWLADQKTEWNDWLAGKQVRGIARQIAISRDMEADCERRTIRLIGELEAPIDLDTYIRAANSYIHFYNTMAQTRKWYAKGKGPYDMPNVLAVANPALDRDFTKTPKPLADALMGCVE